MICPSTGGVAALQEWYPTPQPIKRQTAGTTYHDSAAPQTTAILMATSAELPLDSA